MKFILWITLVVFIGQVLDWEKPLSDSDSAIEDEIRAALDAIVASPNGAFEAKRAIRDVLPREQVIHAIVDNLEHNPAFENESLRAFGYRVLAERRAAEIESGYLQLLKALEDPVGVRWAIDGLVHAQLEKRSEVAKKLHFLLETDALSEQLTKDALRTLRKMGRDVQGSLELVERIWIDRNRDQDVRRDAVLAALEMGALCRVLDRADVVDPIGRKVTLGALASFFGEAAYRSKLDSDVQHRAKAQEWVLNEMQSDDMETRSIAFWTLLFVSDFDDYLLIIRSREDYELNPKVKAAITAMAAHDPDPTLRHRAASFLDPENVDKMVAKVLRQREREKAKDGEGKQHP